MRKDRIEKVVVIGMGALGLLYASQIVSREDTDLTFLMDEEHYRRTEGIDYTINGTPVSFRRCTPENVEIADLVIVATKMTALESAMKLMEYCIDRRTVIVSVCNGITSEKILSDAFGGDRVIRSVAQGMDAINTGAGLAYSKPGVLFIGKTEGTSDEAFDCLVRFFDNKGVLYSVEDDIMLRMWKKFMLNCGVNQSCMVYGTTYGKVVLEGTPEYNTFVSAMREVMQIARAEGYDVTEEDISFYVGLMASLAPDGMPSMAQDRIAKRPSEVDTFAGTVIAYADRLQMDVPVNRWLRDEVRRIEAGYSVG